MFLALKKKSEKDWSVQQMVQKQCFDYKEKKQNDRFL